MIDTKRAVKLNEHWHSRLPKLTNWQACFSYCAECNNVIYAVAMWGPPVARAFNGKRYVELRRMAIADDAPKNTASRMIGWMIRDIKKMDKYIKAISYQDTEVHNGTIYKASGWHVGAKTNYNENNTKSGWHSRKRGADQTKANKIRWEIDINQNLDTKKPHGEQDGRQPGLFSNIDSGDPSG